MGLSNPVRVEEVDGSPAGVLTKLIVSNGSLSLSGTTATVTTGAATSTRSIQAVITANGSAITAGIVGDIEIPFAATLTAVRLFADLVGSIVIDLWKDTYANYPPTVADTITASAKPTLSRRRSTRTRPSPAGRPRSAPATSSA
jgi:hypothetical protein